MGVRRSGATGLVAMLAAGVAVLVGVPAGGFATAPQSGRARDLAAGKLLVAARSVGDPIFAQTVVLLIDRSESGTAGLIVNRQSPVPVERVLPDLARPDGPEARVYFGGPVVPDSVRALLRFPAARIGADQVLSDVFVLDVRLLNQAVNSGLVSGQLRVYAGYAGWGPGQLEGELARGDWFVFDGDSAVVFDPDPDTLWRRQVSRTERFDV